MKYSYCQTDNLDSAKFCKKKLQLPPRSLPPSLPPSPEGAIKSRSSSFEGGKKKVYLAHDATPDRAVT